MVKNGFKLISGVLLLLVIFLACNSNQEKSDKKNKILEESYIIKNDESDELVDIEVRHSSNSPKISYYNFLDKEINEDISDFLQKSGISKEYSKLFFDRVNFFNSLSKFYGDTVDMFHETTIEENLKLNQISIINRWEEEDIDYLDYNARVISYDLFKDFLEVDGVTISSDNNLIFDMDMLNRNELSNFTQDEINEFISLFASINTQDTLDKNFHLDIIKNEWGKRGVKFKEDENISMINIFYHYPELDQLSIGHSAILVKNKEKFYLVEKIGMYLPYQITEFLSQGNVYEYLYSKYNFWHGDNAANNIIMKNGEEFIYE